MNAHRWIGLLLLAMIWGLAACSNGMENQPKYEPFEASNFFADGMSARPLVPNTVARGQLNEDTHLMAGQVDGRPATQYPFPITAEVLSRGQERYNIYCTACHGYAGYGDGVVVARGLTPPPSFHEERLRNLPVGHIFDVITNGFGTMYSYGDRIAPQDRWAIVAYVQALQVSQNATLDDVPPDRREELENAPAENGGENDAETHEAPTEAEGDE